MKLEGNPDHPVNRGALCARGQAALQGLYHPDRFAGPQRREGDALKPLCVGRRDQALRREARRAGSRQGAGAVAMVTQLESGSLGALLDRWSARRSGRGRA